VPGKGEHHVDGHSNWPLRGRCPLPAAATAPDQGMFALQVFRRK
jgi:hypothetical protein